VKNKRAIGALVASAVAIALVSVSLWPNRQLVKETMKETEKEYCVPADHLRPDRVDVLVKYLYGQYRLHNRLEYSALVRTEPLSGLITPTFDRTMVSAQSHQLAYNKEVVLESSDSLAAYMLVHEKQPCLFRSHGAPVSFDTLRVQGVDDSSLDFLAREYCRVKENCYIAVVMPQGYDSRDKIRESISQVGRLVYEKSVKLEGYGPYNYVKLAYGKYCDFPQAWVTDEEAVAKHIAKRFSVDRPLHIFLLEGRSWDAVLKWKRQVRKELKLGTVTLHATDSHTESLALAQLFFDDGKIRRLNGHSLKEFLAFDQISLKLCHRTSDILQKGDQHLKIFFAPSA
jgi:hypothetical protein